MIRYCMRLGDLIQWRRNTFRNVQGKIFKILYSFSPYGNHVNLVTRLNFIIKYCIVLFYLEQQGQKVF